MNKPESQRFTSYVRGSSMRSLAFVALGVFLTHVFQLVFTRETSFTLREEDCPELIPEPVKECPKVAPQVEVESAGITNKTHLIIPMEAKGNGGGARQSVEEIHRYTSNPLSYDVKEDLLAFTGLSKNELMERLLRNDRYHFKVEHKFFNPQSTAELALYYRSSSAYLWANAIHPGLDIEMLNLTSADGPILDYSGGVGSTCLALAKRGIQSIYIGIGLMEYEFAQFRMERHGVAEMVHFVKPYSSVEGGYSFDPIYSLQVGKTIPEELGGIFALDVFEHIPKYQVTAKHLISLLRVGGKLFESTPFDSGAASGTEIHLKAEISLAEAFTGMSYKTRIGTSPPVNMWIKE